jgi:O-antigen ligase/tetratricopeptide (TPR) repeat protein
VSSPAQLARYAEKQDPAVPAPSAVLWWTLLAYLTLIGGTPSGDVSGWVRPLNGALALALILVWARGLTRDHDWIDRTILVGVLIFLVASAGSLFPRQSFDAALQVLALAAGLWVGRRHLARRLRRPNIEMGLGWLAVGVSALVVVMWTLTFGQWAVVSGWSTFPPLNLPLPTGTFGHQHDVAILVCMLVPAVWSRGFRDRWPAMAWIASILTAIIIVLDGSRNVQVAVLLAFGLFAVGRGRPRRIRWKDQRWRIAALAAVLGILVLAAPPLLSRLANLTTAGSRFGLWADSLAVWLQHPVTGIGPGAFPFAFLLGDHFARSPFDPRHPDNALIQLVVEAGLLGLIAMATVVGSILSGAVRTWRREPRATWAVAVFAFACIGANPSDFVFLLAPAIIWVAILTPPGRLPRPESRVTPPLRPASLLRYGLIAIITVAVASTSGAAILYEVARGAYARDDAPGAITALQAATALDPSQSIYWREKASVELADGNLGLAEADYLRAISIEPYGRVALRGLALTLAGRGSIEAAWPAAELAGRRNVWSTQDQIVLAVVAARMGDVEASNDALTRALVSEPELAAATWESTVLDIFDLRSAVHWAAASGAKGGVGPMIIALLVPGTDVAAARGDLPDELRGTADALIALSECDVESARNIILEAESAEREDRSYWLTRALVASALDRGTVGDADLAMMYMHQRAVANVAGESLLGEHGDRWRYRREAIGPITPATAMPSRPAGWARLLTEPQAVAASLGGDWPPNCRG